MLSCNAFSGNARFGYLGAGPFSWNSLQYLDLPNGINLIPARMKSDTGFTAGGGFGAAIGKMTLVGKKSNQGIMIRKDGSDTLSSFGRR